MNWPLPDYCNATKGVLSWSGIGLLLVPTSYNYYSSSLGLSLENFHVNAGAICWPMTGTGSSKIKPLFCLWGLAAILVPYRILSKLNGVRLVEGLALARSSAISSGSAGIPPLLDSRIFWNSSAACCSLELKHSAEILGAPVKKLENYSRAFSKNISNCQLIL